MLWLLLLLPSFSMASASPIFLQPQESVVININPQQKVRVTNSKILQVKDKGTRLVVTAKSLGKSLILQQQLRQRIYVVDKQSFEFLSINYQNLTQVFKWKLQVEKRLIKIEASIKDVDEWHYLAKLYRNYSGVLKTSIQAPVEVQKQLVQYLQNYFATKKMPLPHFVHFPNFTALLPEDLKEHKKYYVSKLSPYSLKLEWSKSHISLKPLVRIDITVAEVSRSWQQELGIEFNNDYQAQVFPIWAQSGGIALSLKALENSGQARVLANPNLISQSGSEARFLAGGEFPIRVSGYKNSTISWKKHGVILKFLPKADYSGNLRLKISTEVSLFDANSLVEGLPNLKTNRISSEFNLRSGQVIVLSGLLQNQHSQNISSIPGLASLPVLGELFKSRQYQKQETELLVFVKPIILNPENINEPSS